MAWKGTPTSRWVTDPAKKNLVLRCVVFGTSGRLTHAPRVTRARGTRVGHAQRPASASCSVNVASYVFAVQFQIVAVGCGSSFPQTRAKTGRTAVPFFDFFGRHHQAPFHSNSELPATSPSPPSPVQRTREGWGMNIEEKTGEIGACVEKRQRKHVSTHFNE